MFVTKRDGNTEEVDISKIHRITKYACEGLNVSQSQLELQAQIQLFDGITTKQIHESLVKTASDLISETAPDFQFVAARLNMFALRKEAYGQFEPPKFSDHIAHLVSAGIYDKEIPEKFSKEEIDYLEEVISHDRDFDYSYAATEQFREKYLVQNRVIKQIYETPQFAYMLIAMCLHIDERKDIRLGLIEKFYDAVSRKKFSLPTTIMSGVRTPTRQFSSCVLIEVGDSLDSINAGSSSIIKYVSQRAGIGLNVGAIRSIGSSIRGGEAFHTGMIPFMKHFQTAVKSCSQGGVRGGAATVFYPLWTYEAESLLVLKNNRGVEDNRVRHLDYGVQLNGFLFNRLVTGGDISLFSPSEVPGLYDAFFEDQEEFARLYNLYEADGAIRKKTVPAIELFSLLAQERAGTGRIYIQNVDHCNTHSPFNPELAPIRQSNLCLEIALPTKPLNSLEDENGEIALCTLSAFNLGELDNLEELEELSLIVVRALDNLLSYQDYPIKAAERSTLFRRSLGVGVTNYAYYLAKHYKRYSDGSGKRLTHKLFEAIQFYLLKASCQLAKEKGACEGFKETTYFQGLLPIDTYKPFIDDICDEGLYQDWESLRHEILEHGLRNSTVTAIMPSETSSQITNSTNGIEPPRGFISIKASKDGQLKQVVPEFESIADQYELLWDIPNNQGYLELVGIMQKFVDQAISANTNYDPAKFPDGKVPVKQILNDLLMAYKLGLKTLYYHNTRDGANDTVEKEDDGCAGGACKL